MAALVVGQALLVGDVADLRPGAGEAMILAATLLWAVEVVLAQRLLAGYASLAVGRRRAWASASSSCWAGSRSPGEPATWLA